MGTLLPTKFYPPPAPSGFVPRPRLITLLAAALRCRLTLVSAPAGSGKTTVVSAWSDSLGGKGPAVGWLSLDEGDNDPLVFGDYVVACLEDSGIGIERAGGEGLARVGDVLGDVIRAVMPLKRDVVLVLDDYQFIQSKEVHAAVEYLIDHAPPWLHLVILTRVDPPLELARLRVAGQLVELRMEQLRFSTEEACEFLRKGLGVDLSEADVAILTERTEGWIAGLQMAAISMRGREDLSTFVAAFAGSHRFVFDYLLEQVLNRQNPETREFLLKTSVLDKLSAALCEAVAEAGGAARELLDSLERANLFLTPLDDEHVWYRYHRLLADLLRLMLEQAHPGLSAELHRRACLWFEAQGMLPESLHHALATGDAELAAHIVSANVLLLVENDEAVPMLRQLDSLPAAQMMARPWLGIAHAWALGAAQVEESQQILDAVERSIQNGQEGDEHQRLQGHLAAARAYLCSLQGDKDNTIAHARRAEELLPRDEFAVRALNLTIWGDTRSDDRRHDPTTMPMLEQAYEMAMQAGKPHVAMTTAAAIASANLHMGRIHDMERICRKALAIADDYERRFQRSLSATANLYSLLARVHAEWGENEQAVRLARKGLMLSERWGQADTEVMCLNYLGRALVFANDWSQARQVSQCAIRAAQEISPWYSEMTLTFTLDSLLDHERADPREIAELRRQVEESGAHFTYIVTARLLLRENRPDEALVVLEQGLLHIRGRPSFDDVRISGLQALAFQAKGEEARALASLRKALKLAEPENRIASLVREGAAMERLLRSPRARTLAPRFVDRLLAAFEARRAKKPDGILVTEALIEPLSEREREVLKYLDGPLSTPEIAEQLVVSTNTVRTHIKSIYGKLGAHGRSAAVRRAHELSLVA